MKFGLLAEKMITRPFVLNQSKTRPANAIRALTLAG
jgi:hypothetical protein